MALDPLKFKIAIEDEATKKIEEIKNKLDSMKDQTIKVNVEGLDDLKSLLDAIKRANKQKSERKSKASTSPKEDLEQEAKGLMKVASALGKVRDAMRGGGGGGGATSVPFLESINKVGERNIQTLIKEQGHIERLIALAKKSIDFGEGHPVAGMGRLRGDQMQNLKDLEQYKNAIKEILFAANQGNQAAIRFLNTVGALKTTPLGKDQMGNNITLLGGHFDQLTHKVTGTSTAMRQLNKDMRLDNANQYKQWNTENLTKGLYRVDEAIKAIKMRWAEMKSSASKELTDRVEAQLSRLVELRQKITSAMGNEDLMRTRHGYGSVIDANFSIQMDQAAKLRRELAGVGNSARQLTSDEQRLAQALNQTTDSARGQSQVLSDLKSLAMQYLGVWGGQQFLHNIIEIGGQLEMQRLSIGAILQNTAQANDLFDQIKSLAVQSPFGVVELDQMTKQLSAYGFKYSELFDMTKRLADISAATGTSVDRLALALGHVRSEAALSGYTLRQFSMANVPLLEKLSERLGKTKKEIREMTKRKEVGYEDVLAVIEDLTNEGGMFYNAQEVMSQSVKAKFKNVKDAMDIMYGEMAESSVIGGPLKSIAEMLMQVTKNWKDAATVIGTSAAVWALAKVGIMGYTTALGQSNLAAAAAIANHRKQQVEQLKLASSYRTLTTAEQSQVATLKLLTFSERVRNALHIPLTANQKLRIEYARKQMMADLQLALSNKKITTEYIARQVAMGKLTKAEALLIIGNAKLAVSEEQAGMMAVINTKRYGMLRMALAGVASAARTAAAAIGRFVVSMGPQLAFMAGISAIMELWMRNKREMEEAGELGDKIFERWSEGIKKVKEVMDSTKMTFTVGGKNNIDAYGAKPGEVGIAKASTLSESDMMTSMETWEEFIKAYSATPNLMLNAAYATDEAGRAVHTLAEQYEILGNNAALVMNSLPLLADVSTAMSDAIKGAKGGWFDDALLKDMKDYENAYKKLNKTVAVTIGSHKREAIEAVNAAREHENFRKAVDEAGISAENLADQVTMLIDKSEKFPEAYKAFKDKFSSAFNIYDVEGLRAAEGELNAEFSQFAQNLKTQLSGEGWDFGNLKPEQIQALTMGISDMMTKAGLSVDEVKTKIMELCKEEFHIIIDAKTADAQAKVSGIKNELDKLVSNGDKNRKFSIDIGATTNFFEVIEKINKAYKTAKENIEKARPILIKMGFQMGITEIGKLTDEKINELAGDNIIKRVVLTAVRDAQKQISDAMAASKAWGFKLEEPKAKSEKKKKDSTKTGSKEDKEAKAWKERIRLLKDARSWYDKWEKEVGSSAALEKVQEMFKGLVSKEDVKTLEAYERALDAVIAKAQARRAKNKNDQRAEEVIRQAEDEKAQIAMLKFQRDSVAFASGLDKEMEQLTRRWEIFNSVLDATGDRMLALRLAGFKGLDTKFNARSAADSLRNDLDASMILPGLEKAIDYNAVSSMSDDEIEQYVKNMLGGTKYESMIGGIVKGLKEWKKLSEEVMKQDIMNYAKLVGSAVDYGTQIQKNNKDFDETRRMLLSLLGAGYINQGMFNAALGQADAERNYKNYQLSPGYVELMTNASALSRGQVDNAIEGAMARINDMYDHNLLTLQQYREEVEKLDRARQDWESNSLFGKNSGLSSYVNGGIGGLRSWLEGKRKEYHESGEWDERDKFQKYINDLDKASGVINDLNFILSLVTGTFEGLQRAATALSTMFDALGKEAQANAWGDLADGISAVSSVFAPASGILQSAQRGDVGGIVSNAIAAPFEMVAGPITGFAQLHDKRRERQIEELKREVEKIDDTLNLIRTSRDRSLGYDNGAYRRMMAGMYANDKSATGKAMYEYYMRGINGSSGYAQELEALKAQREEYLQMYDKENDKKKKSKEALEEYKQKMAELDDQIMNYTQDLANELWSIDLKGWADQIGDALMTAFENGTSAAIAYENAVSDIMRSVVSEMLKVGIIEPMIERLKDRLFGANGVFDYNNPQASMGAVLAELGRFFGKGGEGEQMMTAADEFLTGAQQLLNENYGISLKSSSQASQTEGIKSQATEETVGILSGQMARIAQDVSVKRIFITQLVTDQMPKMLENAQAQRTLLQNQFQSVRAIENMMANGNGAMYEALYRMSQKIDRAITPEGRMRIE